MGSARLSRRFQRKAAEGMQFPWRWNGDTISLNRHSPFGLPPVTLTQPKATFQAISVSGARVVLRAGRIARPNRQIRPFKVSLGAFSDTPFLSPALDLTDLGGFLVMCTLLRQADRAAR